MKRWLSGALLVFCVGFGGVARGEFVDRVLLERAKPFLQLVDVVAVNRTASPHCWVDHAVLGNLIMGSDTVGLVMVQRLHDKYRSVSGFVRGSLWSIGVDPDFPEPLEIYSCSLYEMLNRYVNGESVRVLDGRRNGQLEVVEIMGYTTLNDLEIFPLSELKLMYFFVNGEREFFFNEAGQVVYPYYTYWENPDLKPVHLLALELQEPSTKFKVETITIAEFFELFKNQQGDELHEIWEAGVRPEDNLARKNNPLNINTAPEYENYRKNLRKHLLLELE